MNRTFTISYYDLDRVRERVEKANSVLDRKSEAEGGFEIVSVSDPYVETRRNEWGEKSEVMLVDITLAGTQPSFDGWLLVAEIDHISGSDGNLIKRFPWTYLDEESGSGLEIPMAYRGTRNYCDECQTERPRNNTYLVFNERKGEFRQVGSTCLSLYSPTKTLGGLVSFADASLNLVADLEGYGRSRIPVVNIEEMLAVTVKAISAYGWTSRTQARNEWGKVATADTVSTVLWNFSAIKDASERAKFTRELTEAEKSEIEACLDWARNIPATVDSDYLYNLGNVMRLPAASPDETGLVCSAIPAYRREVQRQIESEARADSSHQGTVGEWLEPLEVSVTRILELEDTFNPYGGVRLMVLFQDSGGNVYMTIGNGKDLWAMDQGESYCLRAKVKEHGEYKGQDQTILSHVKFSKKK